MTRLAPALVQMPGAVLLPGSGWPITRYALLLEAGTVATVPARRAP